MPEKILVIEDREKYREAARAALCGRSGKKIEFAEDYNTATEMLPFADTILTDIFFPRGSIIASEAENLPELRKVLLEKIKVGIAQTYVQRMFERIQNETGVSSSERLGECLETLAYSHLWSSTEGEVSTATDEALIQYFKTVPDPTPKLDQVLEDMKIKKSAERNLRRLFEPLEKYMGESPANHPLGYLIAEEAESMGKKFVLVTSLRHSEGALVPILFAAKAQKWNIMEGANGSKEDPSFWKKAYILSWGKPK